MNTEKLRRPLRHADGRKPSPVGNDFHRKDAAADLLHESCPLRHVSELAPVREPPPCPERVVPRAENLHAGRREGTEPDESLPPRRRPPPAGFPSAAGRRKRRSARRQGPRPGVASSWN